MTWNLDRPLVHRIPAAAVEGGEHRDIESVGGPGSGETVGITSSKDSSTSEGGRESSGSAATQASDSTASSEDEASSAGGGSGGQETRNFEDFGFGGVGAQETIEVNRSKESTSSASLLFDKRTLSPRWKRLYLRSRSRSQRWLARWQC